MRRGATETWVIGLLLAFVLFLVLLVLMREQIGGSASGIFSFGGDVASKAAP